MSSDKKSDSISFINKGKNVVSTDTELHLDLFADQTKLKPVSKVIKMNKINEDSDSDDSHIVNKTMYSDTDSVKSKSSSSSRKSSRKSSRRKSKKHSSESSNSSSTSSRSSSSSSSSSSRRKSSRVISNSHKKLDDYINSYNNIKMSETKQVNTETKQNNDTEKQTKNTTQIGEPGAMPYIPKYQTEREIRFRKMELLCILKNIQKTRELSKNYTMNSELQDMEDEVRFHTEQEQKVVSVGFAKDGLLKICQFMEIMNNSFDPFGLQLKGWHAQMNSNIENYDGVFGELYEKYKNYVGRVEPEYKLMYMVFGSAASFHYSKQFVEQYGLEKLVEKNPELLQKIQANIASTMEKNIGKKDEPKVKKDNMPKVSQQEMYQQMLKEKEELEKKLKDQQNEIIKTQAQTPTQPHMNDTINKMMAIQQANNSGIEIKKPSGLSDLLSKVKSSNTNINASIPLVDTATSASSRIKVINTIDSESISDSDNVQSISKLRLSRRQRPQVNSN
jgi:hypothetical protein